MMNIAKDAVKQLAMAEALRGKTGNPPPQMGNPADMGFTSLQNFNPNTFQGTAPSRMMDFSQVDVMPNSLAGGPPQLEKTKPQFLSFLNRGHPGKEGAVRGQPVDRGPGFGRGGPGR